MLVCRRYCCISLENTVFFLFHWNILERVKGCWSRGNILRGPRIHLIVIHSPLSSWLGAASFIPFFLRRVKKRQNSHYYSCIDVFWQVSRCRIVETVYPPTGVAIVLNNLLARTWWVWSRRRLILRREEFLEKLFSR